MQNQIWHRENQVVLIINRCHGHIVFNIGEQPDKEDTVDLLEEDTFFKEFQFVAELDD